MKLEADYLEQVVGRSEQLHSERDVEQALERLAGAITGVLHDKNPVLLCVMNGAVVPMGRLLPRLDFPLRLDYVHATRYRGATSGGDIAWLHRPVESLEDQHVLVVDDIYDEGLTLEAIARNCLELGARSVRSAVLVEKRRSRACDYRPDFVGLEVEDRYVFGCGMDYKGYLRNYPGIGAVAEEDI